MTKVFPDIDRFNKLKEKNSFIPIFTSLPVMNETPLSLYERLYRNLSFTFLLYSGGIQDENSSFSFLGTFHEPFVKGSLESNHLEQLQSILDSSRSEEINYLIHFWGGAIGYFGYDILHLFEKIQRITPDDLEIPEIFIGFTDEVIVFDHRENLIKIIICLKRDDDYTQGIERLHELLSKLKGEKPAMSEACPEQPRRVEGTGVRNLKSNMTKNHFKNMVDKAKEYIRAGDIFQANLSHRFEGDFEGDPWEFYKQLSNINPSPFGGFINFGDMFIVSASPERLIKVTPLCPPLVRRGMGWGIETRPIAGTRPRGKNRSEDIILSRELLLNEKERAEHIMLVDLERNDLGRVCKYGTVRVDELMTLESYSHVWHIVSKVIGELQDNIKFVDILRACFPGGTITGCPKVRCMEIIEELEPARRGIYTGSMGYIGYNGITDLNIIIRSALIKKGKIYFHAGAGIVADSDPEREYEETLFKAGAIIEVLKKSLRT
ncbi:MAG: anthranilate synthase component I family protein [Nitrospinae bacterium]|nr:anthranilate synthase component I family protein [Nitrospinota bacterium]